MRAFLVAILALFFAAAARAADTSAAATQPQSSYGIDAHVSRDDEHRLARQELKLIGDAGINWVRTDFDWSRVEPKQGDWQFRELDETVDWSEQSGRKLLAIIGSNTPWANPAFRHGEEWSRFVGQLVARYKGRVKQWEVWNEPNLAQFWPSPSPADYTELLKRTYRTIKDADPDATVALGGLSGIPREFIEGIYKNGGRDSFDVMNVHPYCYPGSPEKKRLYEDLVALRALMTRNGDADKPIWITEMGWPTHESPAYLFETIRAGLSALRPKQAQWTMAVLDDPNLPTDEPNDSAIEQMAPGKATLRHVTCAEIRNLNPAEWAVLVLPPEESFPSGSFDDIEGYVRRGGIVVFWYGVPLYFELKRGADGQWNRVFAGEFYRQRLHIGWAAYWTAKGVPREVRPLAPAEGLADRIHPPKDATGVRFLTDAALKEGDRMIPLLTGQWGEFRSVVAAAYSFNSDLKGGVVVSTVQNAATDVSPERQAQILPRAFLLAFQAGVERVFWYELQDRVWDSGPYNREAHFGIVHRDLTPKPAYQAYSALVRARPAGSQTLPGPWQSNGVYYPHWRRPDGEQAWALWAPGADRPCTLEIEGRVKEAFDCLGRPVNIKSSGTRATVTLGESVLYVVGPTNVNVHPRVAGASADTSAAAPTYDAPTDRLVRPKPEAPKMGPAGSIVTDPTFKTRIMRVTDANTSKGTACQTASAAYHSSWSCDSKALLFAGGDGGWMVADVDPEKFALPGKTTAVPLGSPAFSYVRPGVVYGTDGSWIAEWDKSTGEKKKLLDFGAVHAFKQYIGPLTFSKDDQQFAVTFGGIQDTHPYVLWWNRATGATKLLDLAESTIDGKPTNIPMAIGVHSLTMDMSGRFLEIVVNGAKGGCYVWEWATNNIAAVTTATSGHIVLGYGVRVNQSGCAVGGTSDAYGWTLRKLSAPNTGLIQLTDPPAPPPTWGEDGHLSWANVKPGNQEPVLGSLYREPWAWSHPWRFWDDEIIGIATDGSKTVWRFAHHRSIYHSFWDCPRGNVSQDGKFYAFTSNWDDSLGKDRRDVFVVELPLKAPKPPLPATP